MVIHYSFLSARGISALHQTRMRFLSVWGLCHYYGTGLKIVIEANPPPKALMCFWILIGKALPSLKRKSLIRNDNWRTSVTRRLFRRLTEAGQDSTEVHYKTHANKRWQRISHYHEFDYIVVNDDFEAVLSWAGFHRTSRRLRKKNRLFAISSYLLILTEIIAQTMNSKPLLIPAGKKSYTMRPFLSIQH